MVLSDQNIIQAALNVYAQHLRGLENPTDLLKNTLNRTIALREKEIVTNAIAVVIKLNI